MSRTFVQASSQRIDLANQANFSREYTDSFTIATMLNLTSNVSGSIFGKFDQANNGYDFFQRAGAATPTLGLTMAGSVTGFMNTHTTAEYALSTWMGAAVTYDGSNSTNGIVFYASGVAQGQTVLNNIAFAGDTMTNSVVARIGARENAGTPSFFANSMQAEFAFWSAALTASEVAALARGACPARIRRASLISYLPLLGDSPEPDYSGARNNGTVTGATASRHPGVRSLVAAR